MTNGDPQKYDLHVWWSIYVQAKDMGKAKREHFTPIEAVLGKPSVPFQYFKEDGGNYRLVAYINKPDTDLRTAVFETLATAYALADSWSLSGLGCLETGIYRYIVGLWSAKKLSPKPPQLVSMMFEIERGLAEHTNEHGGVYISADGRYHGLEDPVKGPSKL